MTKSDRSRLLDFLSKRARTTTSPNSSQGSVPNVPKSHPSRMKIVKSNARNLLVKGEMALQRSPSGSLSNVERLRLFQALSKEPLPFLDVHGRFDISKRTMIGLVRKGLLAEEWGSKNIGVRFKLTSKGKNHLKRLEAAANFDLPQKKKLIHLRQQVPP